MNKAPKISNREDNSNQHEKISIVQYILFGVDFYEKKQWIKLILYFIFWGGPFFLFAFRLWKAKKQSQTNWENFISKELDRRYGKTTTDRD